MAHGLSNHGYSARPTEKVSEFSAEIRRAQLRTDADRRRYRGTLWLVTLPRIIRSLIWRLVIARPGWTKRFGGTIAVSSVGMFGKSQAWRIPITPAPLMVTIGGIGPRPILVDGAVANRISVSP